jgi:hypothetical protein
MFTLAGEPDEITIGNIEVGGAHRLKTDGPISLVSHLGVVFPTANDSAKKTRVRQGGSTVQVGDYYIRTLPELWALRLATSPRLDAGPFFAQGDLGFDFLFPEHSSNEVGMRTSIGAGIKVLLVTATAEVANAGLISEKHSFNQTFSFGLRLNALVAHPHVTYTVNLNDRFGDNYEIAFGASIGF